MKNLFFSQKLLFIGLYPLTPITDVQDTGEASSPQKKYPAIQNNTILDFFVGFF